MPIRSSLFVLAFFVLISATPRIPAVVAGPSTLPAPFAIAPDQAADPASTEAGYFVYVLEAGANQAGAVRLRNPGSKPLTVHLEAIDAMTARTGGSAFDPPGVVPDETGRWLDMAASEVTLDAGSEQVIKFTVTVPEGTTAGQYLAGIGAYEVATGDPATATAASPGTSVTVHVQTRYVLAVQVDVPGNWTEGLAITGLQSLEHQAGSLVAVAVANTGNTFIKPVGTLIVSEVNGGRVLEQAVAVGTILPGDVVSVPLGGLESLAPGAYLVHLSLASTDSRPVDLNAAFTVGADGSLTLP